MLSKRTRMTKIGLAGAMSLIALGVAGVAHAESWVPTSNMCAFQGGNNFPQVFAYTRDTSGNNHLYSSYNFNGNFSTGWTLQAIATTSGIRPAQIACAAGGTQALVVYRDSVGLKSRDRNSGWGVSSLPGSSNIGLGATLTYVNNGTPQFVLFAVTNTDTISMWTWTDASHWSQPVTLAAAPGGIDISTEHTLGSYFAAGGVNTPLLSVFVVTNDGHLRENKGPQGGSRSWIDHGLAPNGAQFAAKGLVALSSYDSIVGHQGCCAENEYIRGITVATTGGSAAYQRYAGPNATSFVWKQILGAPVSTNGPLNFSGGWAKGCTNINEPCVSSQLIAYGFTVNNGGEKLGAYYSGVTDTNPPGQPVYLTETPVITGSNTQTAYGYAVGTQYGMMFYFDSNATNLGVIRMDDGAVQSIGHP